MDHPEFGTVPVIEHPLKYEHATSGFDSPAPALGEDNREVLRKLGYPESKIDELEDAGIFSL
jgi:crotonobetainyl-CoA:carnitine CoA-transferase CaiB-like acyl-CoA transferase